MSDLLISFVVMLTMFRLAYAALQRELRRNEKDTTVEAPSGQVRG